MSTLYTSVHHNLTIIVCINYFYICLPVVVYIIVDFSERSVSRL